MKTTTSKSLFRLTFGAIALSVLSGCSFLQIGESEYGCKGMPNGVTCMSARDVYAATESENFRQVIDADNAAKAKEGEIDCPECAANADKAAAAAGQPVIEAGERFVVPQPARNPLPIRTQATVMRVWVAPWESDTGDLNVPGYMYTEIEPRRWELGTPAPKASPTIRPLSVNKAQPGSAQ